MWSCDIGPHHVMVDVWQSHGSHLAVMDSKQTKQTTSNMLTAESHMATLYIKFSVVFSHPTFKKGPKLKGLSIYFYFRPFLNLHCDIHHGNLILI